MKKLSLPALATCLALSSAYEMSYAQSSVALFGVADAAFRHVRSTGSSTLNAITSGGNTTSRFGIRGTEHIGEGLSAGFHLESGINIDDGVGGSNDMLFDRRATVSLISKQFGELRWGRDRVLEHILFSDLDPFSYTGIAKASNMQASGARNLGPIRDAMGATASGLNSLTRAKNQIQYFFPKFGGLEAALMYQFDENGTAVSGNHKSAGFRLKYTQGPWGVGIAQQQVKNDITGSNKIKDTAMGGSYDFGPVEVSVGARRWSYTTSTQTNYLVGAVIPAGVGTVRVSYIKADLAGRSGLTSIDGNDATQVGVGYEYPLSKRTALYTAFATIKNKGTQTFNVGSTTLPGGSSKGIDFGIRHTF